MNTLFHTNQLPYAGWPNCWRLANDTVELIVTADVGPRILHFAFVGGENLLLGYEADLGRVGGDEYRFYGGHRLWHAPEVMPRTYAPDNTAVTVENHGRFVRFIQDSEAGTGIQKEIDVAVDPTAAAVTLTHRLRNHNLWAVELAPWALTVIAPGGRTIIPLPPRAGHEGNFLPASTLSLWAYTNMADPRWYWGERFIMLRQDAAIPGPQKVGAMVPDGWVAWAGKGVLFVKGFDYDRNGRSPDLGASVETFTNGEMMEVETLGPLVRLEPGTAVEHVERWFLFPNVPAPDNDEEIERLVRPLVLSVYN
jgi:hypothetical protein